MNSALVGCCLSWLLGSPAIAGQVELLRSTDSVGSHSTTKIATVRNVRLQVAPPLEDSPTALLKFDVFNTSDVDIAEMTIEIAILDESRIGESRSTIPSVIVGPVKIRATHVLSAGYSMHYEMRLRNVDVDCECAPSVQVVQAADLEVSRKLRVP